MAHQITTAHETLRVKCPQACCEIIIIEPEVNKITYLSENQVLSPMIDFIIMSM